MKTWWHRLFVVLELLLAVAGVAVFAILCTERVPPPWWGILVSLVPSLLMVVLHAMVAYVIEG